MGPANFSAHRFRRIAESKKSLNFKEFFVSFSQQAQSLESVQNKKEIYNRAGSVSNDSVKKKTDFFFFYRT